LEEKTADLLLKYDVPGSVVGYIQDGARTGRARRTHQAVIRFRERFSGPAMITTSPATIHDNIPSVKVGRGAKKYCGTVVAA